MRTAAFAALVASAAAFSAGPALPLRQTQVAVVRRAACVCARMDAARLRSCCPYAHIAVSCPVGRGRPHAWARH